MAVGYLGGDLPGGATSGTGERTSFGGRRLWGDQRENVCNGVWETVGDQYRGKSTCKGPKVSEAAVFPEQAEHCGWRTTNSVEHGKVKFKRYAVKLFLLKHIVCEVKP